MPVPIGVEGINEALTVKSKKGHVPGPVQLGENLVHVFGRFLAESQKNLIDIIEIQIKSLGGELRGSGDGACGELVCGFGCDQRDRKSVVWGQSGELRVVIVGRSIIKKKNRE